eukprot:maker-scaffold1550_size36032-snap-gene-0.13 protein:Tk04338 transcript:maker-scaffold1550_size36032-snap-gene-0.13-mRNA-1 annotation:"poly(A) polymerase "
MGHTLVRIPAQLSRWGVGCVRAMSTPTSSLADRSAFQALFQPELRELQTVFQKHGFPLRLAGGAVRDLLSNITPHDLDFATTATPDQMKAFFEAEGIRLINCLGEKHGTITCRINDCANYEVTTLRIDKVTHGRKADVEFTQDWCLDANRRDLTINSMFLDLEGNLYDFCNGAEDLENRHVVFVGDPVKRIQEDYLRILRYFRFFGRISRTSDSFDPPTIEAIQANVNGLEQISGERIWVEWRKIMGGRFSHEIMIKMLEVGLGPYIGLPEAPNLEEFLRVSSLAPPMRPITRIASLLPAERDVMTLHARLKLSGYERDLARFLVAQRDLAKPENALQTYQNLIVDHKGKQSDGQEWCCELLKYRGQDRLLKELEGWVPPRFPVSGNDLVEQGCKKGVIMSLVLKELKERWKTSAFQASKDDLMQELPQVLSGIDGQDLARMKKSPQNSRKRPML